MVVPAHIGLEHPSLLWLVGIGLLAFVAGLWVNLRSDGGSVHEQSPANEQD